MNEKKGCQAIPKWIEYKSTLLIDFMLGYKIEINSCMILKLLNNGLITVAQALMKSNVPFRVLGR